MTDVAHSRTNWSVFRTALLRSAGFPFDWLAELASDALEERGSRLVDAHLRRETARDETLHVLWGMRGDIDAADMTVLNRAIRRIGKGKPVAEPHNAITAATVRWNAATEDFDSLTRSTGLDTVLAAEHDREAALLLQRFTADYFMDAVLLSSLSAYEQCRRTAAAQSFRSGQVELAAYRFLQRFCAKNETGGVGGPLNLISVGRERSGGDPQPGEPFHVDDPVLGRLEYQAQGDGRSAERRTFLSYWAAGELGRTLIDDTADSRPFRLFGASVPQLPPADAHVLDTIDGQRSVAAIAAELGEPVSGVRDSISRLAGLGLVEHGWRAPYFTSDAGEDLRRLAARIDTPGARDVARFVADVRGFAQAKLEDRPALLSAITEDFSRLTDKPAWRGSGRLKGDRAVFYEEARGNVRDARIAAAGARGLSERLATALDFLASQAIEERVAGQALLARELARRNVRDLPAADVRALGAGAAPTAADGLTTRERLLRLVDPSAAVVSFSRADLVEAGLIRSDLDDWPIFGAADLMLTGPDNGAEAGPGSIILSELHHIWPPLASWVRALYADDELGNAELWQTVAGELAPAVPTMQEIVRKGKATDSTPYGHTVLCLDTGQALPHTQTVAADDVVVRRWDNGFIGLHDPIARRDLWMVPDYDDNGVDAGGLIHCATPALSLSAFTLGAHTPRIVIDGVIIQRRRWEFARTDIPSTQKRLPDEREWLALQLWRRSLGLPRRAFFWLDTEGKPMYLDFSSVVSVSNFLRTMAPAQKVVLTEAQPDPERLWLRTKDGHQTSEIRTLLWRDRKRADG